MNRRIKSKRLNLDIKKSVRPYLKYIKNKYGLINVRNMKTWYNHETENDKTRLKLKNIHGYYFEISEFPNFKFLITKFLNDKVYLYIDTKYAAAFTNADFALVKKDLDNVQDFDISLKESLKRYPINNILEDNIQSITLSRKVEQANIIVFKYLKTQVKLGNIVSAQVIDKYYEDRSPYYELIKYQLNIMIDSKKYETKNEVFKVTNNIALELYNIYNDFDVFSAKNKIDYDESFFDKIKKKYKEELRDIKRNSLFYIDDTNILGMYKDIVRKKA